MIRPFLIAVAALTFTVAVVCADVAADTLIDAYPHTYAQRASRGAWKPYRWLQHVGRIVEAANRMPRGRVILNAPPRHGKSDLVSHWTPTWFMHWWPDRNVILASYGKDLAQKLGRDVRDEVVGNPLCNATLREDTQAVGRWYTPQGGGMMSVGRGGAIIGFGGDLIVVDDPIKNWQEAHSYDVRRQTIDWFNSTLYSRCEPGATIIVVMQRWHEQDLCGYLIEEHADDWDVIRLPALAEEGDPLGRQPEEPLCPERYDRDALLAIQSAVTEAPWQANWQQRPQAVGQGHVYRKFTPARNLDAELELRPKHPLCLSIDFNNNPGMHMTLGQWFPDEDLFTTTHVIHAPRLTIEGAIERFERIVKDAGGWRWPELHIFGDATGNTAWVGTTESCYQLVRKLLDAKGIRPYRVRVPKGNPPVLESVNAVNDALCDVQDAVHWRIHPRCKELIRDLREMKTDEHGLIDKREIALSHASDCERYRIHYLRPVRASVLDVARYGV